MTFLTFPTKDDDFEPPSVREPGRILFEIYHVYPPESRLLKPNSWTFYELEVWGHEGGGPFWINEGQGIDHWLQENVFLEQPGWYVLEGVVGEFTRGDGYTTDDDEEFWFERCRYATAEEIAAECLF